MESLLVFRERVVNFIVGNELYIKGVLRFFVSLILFFGISNGFGHNSILGNPGIYIILSLICMFLPKTGGMYIVAIFAIACLYSVSVEYTIVSVFIILLVILLYMQFSPEYAYIILFAVAACMFNMAPAAAVVYAFTIGYPALVPVMCAWVIYNVFSFVPEYLEAINCAEISGGIDGIQYIINNTLTDKEILITAVVLVIAMILITAIKKLSIKHSWVWAMSVSMFLYTLILFSVTGVSVNNIISVFIAIFAGVIVVFFFRNLDYKAVEKVQFEDDEYYYYVKAIPKQIVSYSNEKKN